MENDTLAYVKLSFGIFYLLHGMLGATFIGGGTHIQQNYVLFKDIHGSEYDSVAYITIVNGIAVFLLSSIVIVYVFYKRKHTLQLVGLITTTSFAINLSTGIWMLRMKDSFDQYANPMQKSMSNPTLSYQRWQSLQDDFSCCGTYNYSDWGPILGPNVYPDACCIQKNPFCGTETGLPNIQMKGCLESLSEWLRTNRQALAILLVNIACVNAVFLVFPFVLGMLIAPLKPRRPCFTVYPIPDGRNSLKRFAFANILFTDNLKR